MNNTLVKPYKSFPYPGIQHSRELGIESAIAARFVHYSLDDAPRRQHPFMKNRCHRTTRSVEQRRLRWLNICAASKSRWQLDNEGCSILSA